MNKIAVIAHSGKTFGGGLDELRELLNERGHSDVVFYEVSKSRKAPRAVRKALDDGIDLALVWGGDGTVQKCIDVLAGTKTTVAIMPAGTANLLATNLGVPSDVKGALDVALDVYRRRIDVGVVNGERFAIMAGAGLDALTMKAADGALKDHLGRLAYVWTGAHAIKRKAPKISVKVDGVKWFSGRASCLLFGNMGSLGAGLTAFPHADPSDGVLEVAAVTATSTVQWTRVLSRLALGKAQASKFVHTTRGKSISVKFDRPTAYELDGGARKSTRKLKVSIEPSAVEICVPAPNAS
jgi:diacylglycerol kinase (ATP)